MDQISVILCTFNEKEKIKLTIEKLLKYNVCEIIIVDDDSNDGTIEEIKKFNSNKLKLFQRKKTRGFASAFIYGVMMSKGNFIFRFDVDMYENIDFFFSKIKNVINKDLLIFSRYVEGGDDKRNAYRRIPSLIINKICQIFLSNKIKDYTSAIIYFNKKILQDINLKNSIYGNFIIEFVFMNIIKKNLIEEVPFIQSKSTQENSKSAPNLFKFLYHGSLYSFTIIYCMTLKLRK